MKIGEHISAAVTHASNAGWHEGELAAFMWDMGQGKVVKKDWDTDAVEQEDIAKVWLAIHAQQGFWEDLVGIDNPDEEERFLHAIWLAAGRAYTKAYNTAFTRKAFGLVVARSEGSDR